MELELMGDKKKKRARDEDEDGEERVFWCRETPSTFILCAQLQGYNRSRIEIIIIKEEGRDQSPINEEKPNQKLVIMGKGMRKNEEEILGFRKVFKIPNGVVIPDQIKAEFSEEECILKVCMPKFVKQICGVQIEEVREEEEESGDSSNHKVIQQFKKVDVTEKPNNRVIEIRPEDGESDDKREEDGKVEVKNNSSEEEEQNVGEESQEVGSNKNIVIQSSEESDNEREVDEEIIGGIKEKEVEVPKYKIIEDRDVDVKEEGTEESSLQMKITSNILVERVDEEKGRTSYNNEGGNQESDVKRLMKLSSQVGSLLGTYNNNNNNHDVIGHGGHEIEVEVDEVQREISQEPDGLKDIEVRASEEEKANEQEDGALLIFKEIDNELEDIQVEARDQEDFIKAKEDEVYVEISHEGEERKKLHDPWFVAGSAFVVSLAVFFLRHTYKK